MEIWSKKFNIGNEGKVLYYFHWWQNWIENGISCVSAHGCPICYLLFLIMANCPRLTIVSPWHSFSLNIDTSNFNFPKLYIIIIIIIIIVIIIYRIEVKDLSTFYKMKNRHFNSSWNSCFQFCSDERLRSHTSNKLKITRVRTELCKGTLFLTGFRIYGTICPMNWGLPTLVFLLLRDYVLFFIKMSFSTLSAPIPPGLTSAVS